MTLKYNNGISHKLHGRPSVPCTSLYKQISTNIATNKVLSKILLRSDWAKAGI